MYKEATNTISSVEIKNCVFNGCNSNADKPILCVKLYSGNNWNIVWENNKINDVIELNEDSEFAVGKVKSNNYGVGYYKNIFGVRADGKTEFTEADKETYNTTIITVDGVTRFENCQVK